MQNLLETSDIGGKGDSLKFLIENHFSVPKTFAIDHTYFVRLIEENNMLEEFKELLHNSSTLYRFRKLQNIIANLSLSETFKTNLVRILSDLSTENVIVRSSADKEDSIDDSKAGLFESIVIDEPNTENLFEAIKQCWSSAYTSHVYTTLGEFPVKINLLVQSYILFDKSGVAFSKDIQTGKTDSFIIEAVEGNCDKLVDGLVKPEKYKISKEEINTHSENSLLSELEIIKLVKEFNRVESLYKVDVDIEWGIKNGLVYLVQSRPITSEVFKKRVDLPHGTWVAANDLVALSNVNLDNYQDKYEHFLNKKYWVRHVLIEEKFKVANIGLYFFNHQLLCEKDIETLISKYKSEIIEVRFGDQNYLIKNDVQSVFSFLKSLIQNSYNVAYIAEIMDTKKAGYASVTPNGNIYIEVVLGGFQGMWKAGLKPSKYIVTPEGTIVREEISTFKECSLMDSDSFAWAFRGIAETQCVLETKELLQIIDLSLLLEEKIGGVSNEWTINDSKEVVYFDLSQEHSNKNNLSSSTDVLSSGHSKSTVKRIDSHLLDGFFKTLHEVNVVHTDDYKSKAESELIRKKIEHEIGPNKPIIVTDFPNRLLAPILPYVSGFIFNNGALLCHLSIILRERNIPAIINEKAFKELQDNDSLEIFNDTVIYN